MRVRLSGTPGECAAAAAALREVLDVRTVSGWYRNRGGAPVGRVYIDAGLPTPVGRVVPADLERELLDERYGRPNSTERRGARRRGAR